MPERTSNLSIEALDSLPQDDVKRLPIAALYDLQQSLADAAAQLERRKTAWWLALNDRCTEMAEALRHGSGKDTGTVHVAEGGYDIECATPKNVKWDDAKLRDALGSLSKTDQAFYAKVELSVAEAKYTAAPPEIRRLFEPARTVRPGKETFKITPPKEA